MSLAYLALGDSYTIGEGVPEQGCWPRQLAAALRGEGIAIDDPRIIATTGWTTDELADGIDAAPPDQHFDLVSLLIGVNNQYRGRSVDDYAGQFAQLLQRATGFANGRSDRVLVLSIPDWGVTRFGQECGRDLAQVARELDAYNASAARQCRQHGAHWVDITPLSRQVGATVDALADDGLHPSAAQYRLWMQAALPTARAMLASPTPSITPRTGCLP